MSGNKVFWSNRGSVTSPVKKHSVWRNKMKDLGDKFNFQSTSIIHSGTSFFRNDVCFFFKWTWRSLAFIQFWFERVVWKAKKLKPLQALIQIRPNSCSKRVILVKNYTLASFVVRKRSVCTLKVFYLPQITSSCLLTSKYQIRALCPVAKWNFQMN